MAVTFYQNEAAGGQHFTIIGGDTRPKNLTQLEVEGGIVEWIVDNKGNLTHQRFIQGGRITGFANQNPDRLPR
jgi:hypothetical protein